MAKKILNYILHICIIIFLVVVIYSILQNKITGRRYTDLFGYTFLEVVTGSMSGTIEIGDSVIVKITKDVKENDIIVYEKDSELITHRLIKKEEQVLITKGDANNIEDDPIIEDMVVGKVIGVIPNLNLWKIGIIGILVVMFIGWLVLQFKSIFLKNQ